MLQNKSALTFKEVTCSTNLAGCNKNSNSELMCSNEKMEYTIESILSLESKSTITCQHNLAFCTLPLLIYSGVAAPTIKWRKRKYLMDIQR